MACFCNIRFSQKANLVCLDSDVLEFVSCVHVCKCTFPGYTLYASMVFLQMRQDQTRFVYIFDKGNLFLAHRQSIEVGRPQNSAHIHANPRCCYSFFVSIQCMIYNTIKYPGDVIN